MRATHDSIQGRHRVTQARRGWRGLAAALTLGIVASGALTLGPAGVVGPSAASATTLPPCPTLSTWPFTPITPVVKATLVYYYRARHLTPLRVYRNRVWVLNLALERVGTHWCANPDGGRAGYVGVVPKNARRAVLVRVTHRPYPVTGSATTYATVALLPAGWKVISDDTAP
ncbi:MAG TPA: hypothetical protein PLS29_00520 [Acidimicrobiales bacterium]|nr:MAG: hypothetical protein B7Z69_02910 [Actinobacteria bacterium 21-73-9]HQU25491.1 hypothetical protein [Acidimicrobiales bacterium]